MSTVIYQVTTWGTENEFDQAIKFNYQQNERSVLRRQC